MLYYVEILPCIFIIFIHKIDESILTSDQFTDESSIKLLDLIWIKTLDNSKYL
jgi:hypothetical protein